MIQPDARAESRLNLSVLPFYDINAWTLRFGPVVVKRYRHAARNQQAILEALQHSEWPRHIVDPLPDADIDDVDPRSRLANTVKRLNQNQVCKLLHFRMDGTGAGIYWTINEDVLDAVNAQDNPS